MGENEQQLLLQVNGSAVPIGTALDVLPLDLGIMFYVVRYPNGQIGRIIDHYGDFVLKKRTDS